MLTLPSFRLEAFFAQWEFAARHHLTASDGQTVTVGELLEIAGTDPAELLGLELGYVPTTGSDALREAVASTFAGTARAGRAAVAPDDVLAFAGAEEALLLALSELLSPGDHAVVTVPNYQAMESVPIATGAEVTGLPLWTGSGESLRWTLDVDRVRAALRPTTKVVAVNVPNNPTGFVPDHDSWLALAALCEERGIVLFSDEVYRGVEADPARTLPPAVEVCATGMTLDVTSKSLGLPGLRVGWLVSRDRALLGRIEARKHWTSICNAGPSELLATLAVRNAGALRARLRTVLDANAKTFDAFFADHAQWFDWQGPDGGCVAFPRYRGPDGVEEFCARLLHERGVLLLPASLYASDLATVPADRFRIGLGRRDPEPALAEVAAFLAGPA
ncbi:aminotransferase class I/II-fold pyridoxal phosphate-dependent enzyme [Kineosporia sp. R_H_3]|uniref:aminotransferase class I/II-fold pyridoxal phosphate-dependent enzyme n=1 Tax=Kineosporia sp. R_H_3 TaxID=1961848 RepID=UPI000B4AD677|nr:aminotransferase class I/II-fold pyridoxal phosphate-dependent enzyme [Kineosporia sp. R_H_3]